MTLPDDFLDDLRRRLGDRYHLERELGRGGMGTVYLARERRLDRPVALKVLPAALAANAELRERFLRETRTAASFSHPNIVPVHAVEEGDGLLAFAMGYIEGESLAARVRRTGPLGMRDTVRLLQDVAYALAYAHGRGVVHRDIKPDNIMIERATGRALVMDFGIAREIAPAATREGLTRVGEVVGTPEFMSPEQASGDRVDGRSDLYSLGLTAYFALTARAVFSGPSTQQLLVRQLTELPPPVASLRPDVPGALAAAVERLVQKEPDARFPSAEALVEALESAQLAGPEVSLPIRLLAQDLGQLSLVTLFLAAIAMLLQRNVQQRSANDADIAIPALFLAAVLWGRAATTFANTRRLFEDGFTRGEVLKGFGQVLEERAQDRARLRANPAVLARRRRVVRILTGGVVFGLLVLWWVWQQRVPRGDGNYSVPLPAVISMFAATVMIGVAFVGLLRSPFRPAIGERLFHLFWLGPVGRGFLALAGLGIRAPVAGTSREAVTAAPARPAPVSGGAGAPDRITALEARMTDLERWRATGGDRTG